MKIQIVDWENLSSAERAALLSRPNTPAADLSSYVAGLIRQVRDSGDSAVRALTRDFDGVETPELRVSKTILQTALAQIPEDLLRALRVAIANITKFNLAQKPVDLVLETQPGVRCEKRFAPIETVGIYIPAGSAPLFSTLLMLAIPAQIAGCENIILLSPPSKSTGELSPVILAVAQLLGIKDVFRAGGVQAIAAMAYGTESIPKVDKIFGPGNAYVTEAKIQVSTDPEGATIDLPAGPSEVLVIGDSTTSAVYVASDLLSQAEHDESSQVIFVSSDRRSLEETILELKVQLDELPRRQIAQRSLESCRFIKVRSSEEAMLVSNLYAPEHLIIQTNDSRALAATVKNAGSVFVGAWSPESVGDYASGTNHVLPTYGFARTLGGVGVESFMKPILFQELTAQGLSDLGPVTELLAQVEGLEAHRRAVSVRLKSLTTSTGALYDELE